MARIVAETANPITRGDARWCRAAIDVYDTLRATGTDRAPDAEQRPACVGNGHIIRAWLDAPWTPPAGREPTTNLHANGLHHFFGSVLPDPLWLSTVVDLAQNLGVFGVPGYQVTLDLADPPGLPGAEDFQVTVSRHGDPSVTSPAFGIDDLVPAGRPPTETIVAVIQVVTSVANHLFDLRRFAGANPQPHTRGQDGHRDPAPTWGGRPPAGIRPRTAADAEPVYRIGPGGQAFPPIHQLDPSAASPDLPPPQPPAAGRDPHR
jgi:hypothetical protein